MATDKAGFTLWFTGMHGAGKSTLAGWLGQRLARVGRRVEVLDGAELEKAKLSSALEGTKDSRNDEVRRLGYVTRLLTRNGVIAIAAQVSPYREPRDTLRREIGRFVEVFVDCPVETLIERDQKGLYKKALAGELPNFTGITEPYEPPANPEITVETQQESVEQSAQKILQALLDLGYLSPAEVTAIVGQRARRRPVDRKAARRPARAARRSAAKPKRTVTRKAVRSVKGAAHRRARR
ncbi:MAG TPA: adenylyl-sulfate kinase [Myxococcales bacterium]|nr:adenylyl-sulfate kinase [Myxococcales bacterium]